MRDDISSAAEDLLLEEELVEDDNKIAKLKQNIKLLKAAVDEKISSVKECREIAKKTQSLAGEINGKFKRK